MGAAAVESMRSPQQLLRVAPAALLAISLSGFWLYLGTLDLLGIRPRTPLTAGYYCVLGAAMLVFAWRGRTAVRERLVAPSRVPRVWSLAAAALAVWFVLNAALFSSGTEARDAVALLMLSSIPAALLALALGAEQVRAFWAALIMLGLGLAAVVAVVLVALPDRAARFTPIEELDPISAARVAGLAAVLLTLWQPASRRAKLAQATGVAALIAAAILPGSRGAVISLVLGLVVVAIVLRRRLWPYLLAGIVAGFALGVLGSSLVGSDYYYSVDVPGVEGRIRPTDPGTGSGEPPEPPKPADLPEPISSLAIRRHLVEKALRDVPDRPLFGHGVAMLVADGPDIQRMVEAGRLEPNLRTYPHNVVVEALYSLGLLGFVLLTTLIMASAIALLRLLRLSGFAGYFGLALAAVAAANTSISGEIGSDLYLWLGLALPVALFADLSARSRAESVSGESG